jgi:hypothetical protein
MSEFVCSRRDLCTLIIIEKTTSEIEQYLMVNFNLSASEISTVVNSIQKSLATPCRQLCAFSSE